MEQVFDILLGSGMLAGGLWIRSDGGWTIGTSVVLLMTGTCSGKGPTKRTCRLLATAVPWLFFCVLMMAAVFSGDFLADRWYGALGGLLLITLGAASFANGFLRLVHLTLPALTEDPNPNRAGSLVIYGMEDVEFRFYPDVSTGLTELEAVVRGQLFVAVLTDVELTQVERVLVDIEISASSGEPVDLGAAFRAAVGRDPFEPGTRSGHRWNRHRGRAS